MHGRREGKRGLRCLVLLSGWFLLGTILGQVLAVGMPPETCAELRRCLRGCLRDDAGVLPEPPLPELLPPEALPPEMLLPEALLFVRAPLLTVLFGLTSVAGPLLCGQALTMGLLLSFSVGCFTAAFGTPGILLAAAAMGIRSAVSLPCFLLLAVSFMKTPRHRLGRGAEWRNLPVCLLLCFAVLLLGLCADLYLTPLLLRWAVECLPL